MTPGQCKVGFVFGIEHHLVVLKVTEEMDFEPLVVGSSQQCHFFPMTTAAPYT